MLACTAVLFLASCNTTVRSSTSTFQTGKVLDSGETRVTARSTVYPIPLLAAAQAGFGLDGGWEIEGGYGAHGLRLGETDAEDATLHGPQLFVTKALLPPEDLFGVSATAGVEANLVPEFDAVFHLGPNVGVYPEEWFTVFAGVRGVYVTGGQPGALIHLGLGIDGPVQVKLAGYVTPFAVSEERPTGPDVFWPYFVSLEVGGRF
jgi:hypothetical protein